MDTNGLKKFAQEARRALRDQISGKLDVVLAAGSGARREAPKAVQQLEGEIARSSRDQVVEKVAYTWFNRFSALRFMDANGYTGTRVVSPADGQTRPEILSEAMAGVISEEVPAAAASQVRALLDGRTPSTDPHGEAYRLLVVATCNHWHGSMPFLFEKIADYTEMLMPDDLLSASSVVAKMRAVMNEDACKDVEIIGWLYQFYVLEKKEEVDKKVKTGGKVLPTEIPPKTALFTPHWIVRYLVENSLGRLWMLNRPTSSLHERMDYYIAPQRPEEGFLQVTRPEDIKICDPACGSGHMLTYAFDLLRAIYEEEGYDAAEIPQLILTHNLYGIEIDERAGALAAFALTMKSREMQRRFFQRAVMPNICVLDNVAFETGELADYFKAVGVDLFTNELIETLHQFAEVKNFGSLIRPALHDVAEVMRIIDSKDFAENLFLREVHARVQAALRMADYLSSKYHVVVANPPYLGSGSLNASLGSWIKKSYPDSKADLFAAFIERGLTIVQKHGFSGMVTMESWMFLSSYEKLRIEILENTTILSMVHMPYLGKGSTSMGINFGTTAFVVENFPKPNLQGHYCCVRYYETDEQGIPNEFPPRNEKLAVASAKDFERIPGSPLAYSATEAIRRLFDQGKLGDIAHTRLGMATADNNQFVRLWPEISSKKFEFGALSREVSKQSGAKWFPYQKGGDYRKWYGNLECVVNWQNDGFDIQNFQDAKTGKVRSHNYNLDFIFKTGVTWSALTSGKTSARLSEHSIFDNAGSSLFAIDGVSIEPIIGFINSNVMLAVFPLISPTFNYQPGDLAKLPAFFPKDLLDSSGQVVKQLIVQARSDWDSFETSWDFTTLPLLASTHRSVTLADTYQRLRSHWRSVTEDMRRLEEENNHLFIDAYGLQDELTAEVPWDEVTLTCNPAYRYGVKGAEEEREARLRADTMAELLSYAVGCMFGRYSLDAPGLIIANQGERLEDYLARVPAPSFEPDADNVIPVLEGDWFADDITERFRLFLRVTFGEERFRENLAFIEAQIGDIRKYFTRGFYDDHLKRYKKRPIYWMFSSPKGTFNALIYMHRYQPNTLNVVLNDYLRVFRSKLEAHKAGQERLSINAAATASQRTAAIKEIQAVAKQIDELDGWERDVIYPMATRRIEINLDDGVKANYPKFARALKPIKGLEEVED